MPLNPKSMVTIACRGSFGTTGATAGVVPWVMTSGLYTDSLPVRGSRMVAWTNAPRLAALVIVQPDAAGVVPSGPVSWYGVARPCALSGFAGTMMSQLTLAAAAAAGAAVGRRRRRVVVGAADAAATAAEALADGLAEAPRADWSICVVLPPETARMIPSVSPNAIGMARGTARRAARLLPPRRHADRCPLCIQSTSMDVPYDAPGGSR